MKNASGFSSFGNLGLQAKIQIVVNSFILILLTFATILLSHSIKTVILDSVKQRGEGIADEVVDGSNMLMQTREISVPENGRLLIKVNNW